VTFEVKPQAEAEAQQAALYLERQRRGFGDVFLDRLADAYDEIEHMPRAFSPVQPALPGREIRRRRLVQFPYTVIYELVPNRIVVLAVMHAKRRPFYWRGRTP
jgi:plasmid stabilization system protein ParE